jgi:hypothetical protein
MARQPRHSNVKAVVDHVIEARHAFEKTLIFYFRNNIARLPRDIRNERLASELSSCASAAWRDECAARPAHTQGRRPVRPATRARQLQVLHNTLDPWAKVRVFRLCSEDMHELARLGLRYCIA